LLPSPPPLSTNIVWPSKVRPSGCRTRGLSEKDYFELRFYLDRIAQRITYFFAGEGRLVLLSEFRKQRMSERGEIARARAAMARCIREGYTAEEDAR
jgi:hypothetical protein